MPLKSKKIAENADGIFIRSNKFNTTLISFNFYLPLSKETVAEYALLPFVLTTCGKKYPDFSELNFKLSRLYGAELIASSEKVGDLQLLKIGISVINNRFTLDNDDLVGSAADMLESLIFEPKAENEEFSLSDVEREKNKAVQHILGEFSEKRIYAKKRLIEEMYKNMPYGVPKCGTTEQIKKITGKSLYKAYKEVLSKAYIRVNVISDNLPLTLFSEIGEKLSLFDRENKADITGNINLDPALKPVRIDEKEDVTQCKLAMGFTSEIKGSDKDTAALMLACDIFGGGPNSKLFSNVREKMSLCYYCAARCVKIKGLVTVESGVELENIEKTESAVLAELEKLQSGEITDFEFESSKKSCVDSLNSFSDGQGLLDTWYSLKIFESEPLDPESLAELLKQVTKEEIIEAAKGIKLHTVFRLLPKS